MRTLIDTPRKAALVKDLVVSFHPADAYRGSAQGGGMGEGMGWMSKARENGLLGMLYEAMMVMHGLKFLSMRVRPDCKGEVGKALELVFR